MLTRFVSGLAGLGVTVFGVTWQNAFSLQYDDLPNLVSGFVTFSIVMLGCYLIFFCLTGDWLPKSRKGRRNS